MCDGVNLARGPRAVQIPLAGHVDLDWGEARLGMAAQGGEGQAPAVGGTGAERWGRWWLSTCQEREKRGKLGFE
jgi:hypothetical protein